MSCSRPLTSRVMLILSSMDGRSRIAQVFADTLGGGGNLEDLDPERRERIDDCIDNGGGRADCTAFSHDLPARYAFGGNQFTMKGIDFRDVAQPREQKNR